jgi:predicted dehydrogenase
MLDDSIGLLDKAAPARCTRSRRSRPPKPASTCSARSRSGGPAWGADPALDAWRLQAEEAGGTLGDTGAHVIDLARFLAGEISSVAGVVRTFISGRAVDDAIAASVEFEGVRSARSRRRA